MGTVTSLDDARPHITITTLDGNVHVVPVAYFVDVAKGKQSIDTLDRRDAILRVIVAEWLEHIGAVECGALREIEGQ
ncbi:MAG: hypothetical protein J0I30_11275 [Burkholderiales bacterium]|nr:hypothetical protein [Burkholderiales bacterium]